MADLLADVLAAAADAAADESRGKLLYRYGDGRECRATTPDTMVMSGGGLPTLVNQIEGMDFGALT